MARQVSLDVSEGFKELITSITGYEEATEPFMHLYKSMLIKLKKSDTMYFLNKREVDQWISGMAEKYNFHSFFPQAKALEDTYNNYMSSNLSQSDLNIRLNIVRFLLCMSERPTNQFLERPEEFVMIEEQEEEQFNWAAYLNEGIEPWNPKFDDSSENSSDSDDEVASNDMIDGERSSTLPIIIRSNQHDVVANLRSNREELLNTIQHTWYNRKFYHDTPFSERKEANIGILWEKFLEKEAMGLIDLSKISVLSEYKVIREILWQLWSPHTSAVFELKENKLLPRNIVTISSIRSMIFESFLTKEFIPHIELLDMFREFSSSLEIGAHDCITLVPQTYRGYNNSLQNIIRPIYARLVELEQNIREQETTYTLLNLSSVLKDLLEPVFLLKKIHKEVVIDFSSHDNLECALTLLSRLHSSIQYSTSKLDQDLRVTLFLGSLHYYFNLIDSWLRKNDLADYSKEFLIENKNEALALENSEEVDVDIRKLNFDVNCKAEQFCSENGIMKIIKESVLPIGRHLHLLILLGKYALLNEESKGNIYDEFIKKSLEELCRFFDKDIDVIFPPEDVLPSDVEEITYKYPVISCDSCKDPTDMDRLENLVDTSDGFLMLAFEDYFVDKQQKDVKVHKPTLFEKISTITTSFFPVANFFENIFNNILKDRFTISGLMVKNLLIEDYLLEKQFQFLRHLFLFFDDIIFPFYRRLFEKTNSKDKNWGNNIWLTSHIQDIIMDIYPDFYHRCFVKVNENWKLCPNSLEACNMISFRYEIQWPLNIIINSSMMKLYEEIFQFLLKLKWGLYTLNHLSFTDLESKKDLRKTKPKAQRQMIMRMKYLKFALTNLLNSVQHYIFSFAFTRCLQKFELEFEKANDLSSITTVHAEFINTVSLMTMEVKNSGKNSSSFEDIIACINYLEKMWTNLEGTTLDRLQENYKIYKQSYSAINPIINPVYIFHC